MKPNTNQRGAYAPLQGLDENMDHVGLKKITTKSIDLFEVTSEI